MDLIAAFPMPAVLIGRDERIRYANALADEFFGQGIMGRHYITAFRQPALLDAIEETMRTGKTAEAKYLTTSSGRNLTLHTTVTAVSRSEGVLMVLEDRSAMEEVGQMRRDFVANVSHELRTPLTAMLGFIETLRGAARHDPAAQERFLSIMESEAHRMNRLVGDLLSLSRVEATERIRPTDPVELGQLVRNVVSNLEPLTKERDVKVIADVPEAELRLAGDADQLSQVVTNLMENALKYTAGSSTVTVSLHEVEDDPAIRGPAARLSVTDQGDGIEQVHIPRLTERFYRVDTHRSREMGGTGLGLAIVKHIVNRHRGRLRVKSTVGEGSTFTIVLPLAVG